MNINMEFSKQEEDNLSDDEKEIVELILGNKTFDEIIQEKPTVNNYIHLSRVKENLLNWYDFKENSSLLEIGAGFGELTNLLLNRKLNVISIEPSLTKAKVLEKKFKNSNNFELIVGYFDDIDFKDKFDYIVITDYLDKNDFSKTLIKAKNLLKNNGTIFLAINNKYGIKNWKGKDDYKDILNKDLKFSKRYIENDLNKLGFTNYKFYYIYPEYKAPNLIYTDNYKITTEDISRNFELNEFYEEVNFRENELLENVLNDEEDVINFFANSFLVEISNSNLADINYVTFTNYRKLSKQIQTIITNDKVIKKPITEEAKSHIDEMLYNQQYFPKNNCVLLDKKQKDGIVESDFITGKKLDEIIKNSNNYIEEFDKYKEFLFNCQKIIPYDEVVKEELLNPLKCLDDEKLREFNFVEYGFLDMIPKNCFVVGGMNFFFDQEWMIKFIPLQYILYRAINNMSIKILEKNELFTKYDLDKNIKVFEDMENCFIDMVMDRTILTKILTRPAKFRKEKINLLEAKIENIENKNKELELIVKEKENQIIIISNSLSWRITRPLRWISSKVRKLINNLKKEKIDEHKKCSK